MLSIAPRVAARARIIEQNPFGPVGSKVTFNFDVPYDTVFERPSSGAAVEGIYTTNLGTGYTLTISVDAAGNVTGSDTNGCNLAGSISTSHPDVNYYDISLDVSTCGSIDGRYNGNAALIFDGAGRVTQLFLSASNANAAIGWELDR